MENIYITTLLMDYLLLENMKKPDNPMATSWIIP